MFISGSSETQRAKRLILLLAVARFILPYLLQHPMYEPHRDEFLYLAEGRHLSWGYLEVPPLLSVFAWLTHALGNSIFWIKFWPNLFGTLTFILCARIAIRLDGGRWAIWLLFFAFIFSAWLRMFFLFQPNAPEIFFCTLMAYALFMFIRTVRPRWLYVFGAAVGLGMLSKYTVAFWTISLLTGLLLTRLRGLVFKNKHFYLSMLLAFFIFLPNLLWQAVHNFPVLHHMSELKESQLQYVSKTDFFFGQFLMYLPVFFLWIAGLIYCFSFKGRHERVFGFAFILMQFLMMMLAGKSYYTAGAFPLLFTFGSVLLERLTRESAGFFRYALIVFPVLTGVLLWPILLPVFKPEKLSSFYRALKFGTTGALTWHDRKIHELPQDFADMLGWQEMAAKTALVWHSLTDAEKDRTMIWAGNYGQAGAINYYAAGLGLPEAYSDNGSFIFWNKSAQFPENIILISDEPQVMDAPELKEFASAKSMATIENKYAVEWGTRIVLLRQPSRRFQEFFEQRTRSKLEQFGGEP